MPAPRRSNSSSSFRLNIEPEPLFHDEEIAFSGVNIHNPLWERGDSFSSSWRGDGDEDQLLRPKGVFAVTKKILPRIKQQQESLSSAPKSSIRTCVELSTKVVVAVSIICGLAGIVAFSFTQSNEVWASSGLIVGDDDAIVDQGMIAAQEFDCTKTTTLNDASNVAASFTRYVESTSANQNATLCEHEVRGLGLCYSISNTPRWCMASLSFVISGCQ